MWEKHGVDFEKYEKEILPDGQIIYTYDNGSYWDLCKMHITMVVCSIQVHRKQNYLSVAHEPISIIP